MEQASLGDVIRQEREAQGLSIRQLARLIEAAPSQILRWEHGDRVPKTPALLALAEQLELPATQLLALAGQRPVGNLKPSIPAMLRTDYDLPPEAIKEVEDHIAAVAKRYRKRRGPTATHNPSTSDERRET